MKFFDYTPKHILEIYDRDMKKLFGMLFNMAQATAVKLNSAKYLLITPDPEKTKEIVDSDRDINNMEKEINQCVLNILALRRPLAEDLRWTIFTLKTASDIEKIADLIKKVVQHSYSVNMHPEKVALTEYLTNMVACSLEMFQQVMLTKIDAGDLSAIIERDKIINDLYSTTLKHLFTQFNAQDIKDLTLNMNIVFLAKNIEWIGDTIVHIAQHMYDILTGIDIENTDAT